MCGIVGIVGPGAVAAAPALERACIALAHRGPDGRGVHVADGVALGHTRLAILDRTARSDQPMIDPVTGSVLVFNGEIYNYRELRAQLQSAGIEFRSEGDTEVVLGAYRRWGSACIDRFNGMFALALWDPGRQAVWVARDRLGEKPMHLVRTEHGTWFASEVKALVAAGVLRPATERDQLFRYLTLADVGHPTATAFAGVTQLPAAHTGWIDIHGTLRTGRYWAPPPPTGGPDVPLDEIVELWEDSIRLRLRSDVPVGTSLSGGVDSSAVVATVRRLQPDTELHAFTASFPGTAVDELPEARFVADRVGATIHPVPLGPEDLAAHLDSVLWANEAPVEAPSILAQLRVMNAARAAGIVVLLDGQGGDECFGGYDKYAGAYVFDLLATGRLHDARRAQQAWLDAHERPLHLPFARLAALSAGVSGRTVLARVRGLRTAAWLSAAYRRGHGHADPLAGDPFPPVAPGQWSAGLRRQDLVRVTLPRLLRYGDRVSMSCSREVRLPYLDHRLLELAARIPPEQSFAGGWSKAPLRQVLARLDLPEVAWRKDKKNFMPPTGAWLDSPGNRELVEAAWEAGYRAGVLADVRPTSAVLPRWRVLCAWRWMELFGTSW